MPTAPSGAVIRMTWLGLGLGLGLGLELGLGLGLGLGIGFGLGRVGRLMFGGGWNDQHAEGEHDLGVSARVVP